MSRRWRWASCVLAAMPLPACLSGGDPPPDAGRDAAQIGNDAAVEASLEIGTVDGDLSYTALEEGGAVPLETFGQGGTHASLAVRCFGLGDRAFVDVSLENLETGATVMTAASTRPPLLICRDEAETICDLPLYVMTGGLADPDEKDGLRIRIRAQAENLDGVGAKAMIDAVLRKPTPEDETAE